MACYLKDIFFQNVWRSRCSVILCLVVAALRTNHYAFEEARELRLRPVLLVSGDAFPSNVVYIFRTNLLLRIVVHEEGDVGRERVRVAELRAALERHVQVILLVQVLMSVRAV